LEVLEISLKCVDVTRLSLAEVVQYRTAYSVTHSMKHDAQFTGVNLRKIKTQKTPQPLKIWTL
jgi:hypothetical protein